MPQDKTLSRLYFPERLGTGNICRLPAAQAHHVERVLRLKPGAALILTWSVAGFAQTYVRVYVLSRIHHRMRVDVYRRLLRLPGSYHDRTHSGDLVSRLTNDLRRTDEAIMGPLYLIQQPAAIALYFGYLLTVNATLAFVVLLFGPAMIVAARGATGRGSAIIASAVQFLLNLAWSPVFFGAHQLTGGLILIVLLDVAAILTAGLFYRVRPVAAALLVPYIAWLLFATWLNFALLQANPKLDGVDVAPPVERFEI